MEYEIVTSEDSQKESQALGILFADTLLKCFDKRRASGKENFKWDGSLTDLKSFVEMVLKLKGKWTGKKSGGKQTFQGDKVSINWWPSKKMHCMCKDHQLLQNKLKNNWIIFARISNRK